MTSLLRNIGIISHINAGKTTTSERILFFAGKTSFAGNVDDGNTITDYLLQERNRGITITSSAVSLKWKKHRINLIDTPGHVDFTVEVERSLSVLDGAVTILDSTAGVEAQTMTVWNQASKYKLPNVILLNKYDKPAADYNLCLSQLKSCLHINPLLTQLPVIQKGQFDTLIDLIDKKCLIHKNLSKEATSKPEVINLCDMQLDKGVVEKSLELREALINNLTDLDDEMADHVLECSTIDDVCGGKIKKSLRKLTLSCAASPVLIGSSFRYVGVHSLLDAVIDYLPSPQERRSQLSNMLDIIYNENNSEKFIGFIFKILHDKRNGPLTYVKICNGSLDASRKQVINLSSGESEVIKRIYEPFADDLLELKRPINKDEIVVFVGLEKCKTGDILAFDENLLHSEKRKLSEQLPFVDIENVLVPVFEPMNTVYYCTIEGPTVAEQMKFESALNCMSREDPSFTHEVDDNGFTIVRGMGKLHLEIIRDRIETEYNINSTLGPLQISYKETLEGSAEADMAIDKVIGGVKQTVSVALQLKHKTGLSKWTERLLKIDKSRDSEMTFIRSDHQKAVCKGIGTALTTGPILGYPIVDCEIKLMSFYANSKCSYALIASCASQCVKKALKLGSTKLLEPIMSVEIISPIEKNGLLLSDISGRRGNVTLTVPQDDMILIKSYIPLSTMSNYAEFLRVQTSGRATFSMTLHGYVAMSEADKALVFRS